MSLESSEEQDRESQLSTTTTTTEVEEDTQNSINNNLLEVLVQRSPLCNALSCGTCRKCCTHSMREEAIRTLIPSSPIPHVKLSHMDSSCSSSQSPARARTYEIQVRNLCYKIIPPSRTVAATILNSRIGGNCFIRRVLNYHQPDCEAKYILKNVNCVAKPGEILAIAGPSGAGKSTLLEILAGRIRPNSNPTSSRSILVNKQPMDSSHFRRISGYVMQHDALSPLLTVFETLMFSAHLRLPASMSESAKKDRVESLIAELGLLGVASSRIGSDTVRGVSGGERRRVSIGVDVLHDPAVLLLDEPTSGLDSAGALQVVGMLHNMAQSHGRTIILSIHQPSFRILQLLHSILLLANGSVIHSGPLDLLSERLAATGHRIPPQVNVVEYAIETIDLLEAERSGMISNSISVAKVRSSLQDLFEQLKETSENREAPVLEQTPHDSIDIPVVDDKPMFANSRAREIVVLSQRFGKIIVRTRELFVARTSQALFAGLGLGSIFLKLGHDQRGVQERYGFLAFSLTFLLSSNTEALPMFLDERQIFMRETSRGAYRVSSYVISNTLVFIPYLFVFSMLYSVPTYWLVGLNPELGACLFFLLVVWLVVVMANSFVAFFSALVPNYIMGNTLISGIVGAFFLFSGYFIAKDHIPKYWLFMHYLSLFKYPLDALLINEYSSVADKCFGRVIQGICTLTGRDVLAQSGLENSSKWNDVGVMIGFCFGYRLICYIVLRLKPSHRQE